MKRIRAADFDLTQGGILNKLLLVAVPIMGTQLMQMAYNLTDMFWLGRVGSDAVASSGTAGTYMWLSGAFLMIGRMGAEIGVSQSLGRGERDAALRYSQNGLFLAAVLGVLYGAVMMLFCTPLVDFFNIQDPAVAADAARYLVVVGAAIPFTFLSGTVAGTFNGSGNSRMPFFINGAGLAVNMVLDPLLIFSLDTGVMGAAVATALAQVFVCVLSLAAVKKSGARPFQEYRFFARPDRECIRQIFRWSVPIAVESMFFTLLSMIISRFVAAWGTGAMAVQRVGSQIESLSWLIGGGFSSALTAFVGQNYGAGKWSRIHRGFRISLATMVVWGVTITVIMVFGARALFSVFLPDPALTEAGVVYVHILATCQIVACMEYLSAGAFRGIGKTLPPSVVSISCNTIRVFLAYYLSNHTPLGITGLWWGITLGAMMRGVWLPLWYLIHARKQPKGDLPSPSGDPPPPSEGTVSA